MEETNMKDTKLVCSQSEVLLHDWITVKSKAKALQEESCKMNYMAREKYGCLTNMLIQSCTTSNILKDVITLIFNKAILEPAFCPMYAQLCYDINGKLPTFPPECTGGKEITFKRVLLNRCQSVFEGSDEFLSKVLKKKMERLFKQQTRGNLLLIGELFKLKMIPGKIVHYIILMLLGIDEKMCPSDENIEDVCYFLKTIGKKLDGSFRSKGMNDLYFIRLEKLKNHHPQLIMRSRFMIQNIINLRSNRWVSDINSM